MWIQCHKSNVNGVLRVLIEGIDRHSTLDAFTHNPATLTLSTSLHGRAGIQVTSKLTEPERMPRSNL